VPRRDGVAADVAARLRDRLAAAGLDSDQLLRDAADNDYIMWPLSRTAAATVTGPAEAALCGHAARPGPGALREP
jgi:hypothetical protein